MGHMYDVSILGNPKSLDPQFATDSASNTIIKNLYSGLMTTDTNGNIMCGNAESYTVSADGMEYTFNLRRDNYWYFDKNNDDIIDDDEYFPVTSQDYVFALRRILDPAMHSPYAESFSCIRNGGNIISGKALPETAGLIAVDDYTLNISLDYPSAEFLGLLATNPAMPCNRDFFYSTKGRYGLDDRSVMSNGAFYVRQWFYDPYGVNNILYMKRNEPNRSETNDICPSYLNFTIESSEDDIRNMFKNGDIECFSTLSTHGLNPDKYTVTAESSVTLGLVFSPENKQYSNKNIRQAFALSTDRRKLAEDIDGTDLKTACGIIPPAVKLLGRSYRELVADEQFEFYNAEEAKRSFKIGKAELDDETPESTKILVCNGTVDSSCLQSLTQKWHELFGLDIGIEEVTKYEFERCIAENDYTIALYPLKADYCSSLSVIEQFTEKNCLSYTVDGAESVDRIRRCADISELVDCYCAEESRLLDGYGFIPLFYKNSYLIMHTDNEDIVYDAFTGAVDFRNAKNFN
ncbi:MAG: peptide ABC transporter substrate-binding protein [Ruminococcus sp.]|nr:peptide ABC transporter substrate-binding protein [Ruminococcus sp.]